MDLFSAQASRRAPLADRMRPRTLDEFIGQEHIVGKGRLLRRAIETDTLTSSIFFGPPGCGKTTLASVIAAQTGAKIAKLNAVTAGVKEVRAVIEQAEKDLKLYGTPTYLLLDECHRWSKTQSDSILPALESGIDKLRINPGNIGADYKVKELCERAKERRVPIRIGLNSGCMEKELLI